MPTAPTTPCAPCADHPDPTAPASAGRRDLIQKLAVGGAVVWTAPFIARTASAASATSCDPQVLDWNAFAVGSNFTSANVGGTTVELRPSTFFGGSTALGTNRTLVAGPQGAVPGRALRFEQTPRNNGGQVITIRFSQAVHNVSFTITDIDTDRTDSPNNGDGWSDRITVVSPAHTFVIPAGSTVIGAGTAAGSTATTGRFRNSNTDNNFPNSSNAGNVTLRFTGPLTELQFQFRCDTRQNGSNQLINLTNISFCA